MKADELRIGNKVQYKGFIFDVVSIYDDGTVYCDFEGNQGDVWEFDNDNPCQGIELTEEILLKCGFEKIHENGYYSTDDTHVIFTLSYDNTLDATIDSDSILNENIKYVHQLQNLYFALTNEELTIKL